MTRETVKIIFAVILIIILIMGAVRWTKGSSDTRFTKICNEVAEKLGYNEGVYWRSISIGVFCYVQEVDGTWRNIWGEPG